MDRPWLKQYPAGVPAKIDASQYRSLAHLLEDSPQKNRNRRAFKYMGEVLTYGELDTLSRQPATWLRSHDLAPDTRAALMMPDVLQYPVALVAVLRAGYVVINVNPLYTPRELKHQLKDSDAEAIIILENFMTTLQQVLPNTPVRHIMVASMGDLLGGLKGMLVNFVVRSVKKMVPAWELPDCIRFNTMLEEGAKQALELTSIGPDDVAFPQYTGGTTDVSKGTTLLHRNIVASVLQSEAWMNPALTKPGRDGRMLTADEEIIAVTTLPPYHIFALTVCYLLLMRRDGLAVPVPSPHDIPDFVKMLKQYRFHMFSAVNTLYNALLNNPEFKDVDCSNLRVANGGGMTAQEAVAKRWFEVTGCPIIKGYGLSGTSPSAICNPTDTDKFPGTVGLPIPGTEIAIRDDEGCDLPIGQVGKICIRDPQVMAGYWRRPDEATEAMYADGSFKASDVGVVDERGYTKIVDRKKDMILVSGFNVYPNEIEDVVTICPDVLEVAVVGVSDVHSDEVVRLFMARRDSSLTEQKLQEFCKNQLTGYKRPKFIEFRNELPKADVGKILRRELRDEVMKKRA